MIRLFCFALQKQCERFALAGFRRIVLREPRLGAPEPLPSPTDG
jgi:hypothetical protein